MFVTDRDKKTASENGYRPSFVPTGDTKREEERDIMNAATVTIFAERPMSTNERAKLFAKELAARTRSTETSPAQSLASSCDGIQSTTLRGDLVDLKEHLEGFEARLYEPRVGQIMDATSATTGKVYVLREELRR